MTTTTDARVKRMTREVARLIRRMIAEMADEDRASAYSTEPSLQLTIAADDDLRHWAGWIGGQKLLLRRYTHWTRGAVYRDDTDPDELAGELVEALRESVAEKLGDGLVEP